MRIFIGLPSGDMVHKGFCISLCNLLGDSMHCGIQTATGDIRTTAAERGRNMAVRGALEWQATHILWIDSDMTFPHDALRRLLSHQKDIVGASYRMRREPYAAAHIELDTPETESLRRVKRLPSGMLLVRMQVYEQLDLPWYRNPYVPGTEEIVSQDYDFCDRSRALGVEVWMDATLSKLLGHLGEHEYRL